MQQLSSVDASFIQAESPGLPMHVTTVGIYDPSTAPHGTLRFRDIMECYERAIYEVPLLRRRLVQVPGNLDFPYWIEDPDFDIEFHVRHMALPQPGDWRQFFIQVARMNSRVLDLQRPLWEVYVLEGLNALEGIPKGSFAVMQKLHHAAMDGDAVRKLLTALHTDKPTAPSHRTRHNEPLVRENRPNKMPLLLKSYQRALGRPGKFTRTVARSLRGLRRLSKAGEVGKRPEPPKSIFNGEVSPHRVVSAASFDFEEFRHLRHAVPGATVSDLAVSVMGGALRRYMAHRGVELAEPLVARVPVSVRPDALPDEVGNRVSTITASSGSHIADPLERLQEVYASSSAAKRRLEIMGDSLYADMADALGPQVSRAVFSVAENAARFQALSSLLPAGHNFSFSNLPGPADPVYLCGAEYKWGMGLDPLMPNIGLVVTLASSRGRFVMGVNACREMVPDPEVLWQFIHNAYDEARPVLQAAAAANTAGKRPSKKASGEAPGKAMGKAGKKPAKKVKKKAAKKRPAAKRKPGAKSKPKSRSA